MVINDKSSAKEPERTIAAEVEAGEPVRWLLVLLIVLPLVVINCGWITYGEIRANTTWTTISTLFMGVTFFLFIITLVNLWVRRYAARIRALNQPEMMMLYTLLSMSSAIAGVGNFGFFTPFLGNLVGAATPLNGWKAFWYLLPNYVGPRDNGVIQAFELGHSSFFQRSVMEAWARPLCVWTAFFLILIWTTLCLSVIIQRRWSSDEKLSFPVLALPFAMTSSKEPLYSKKLLWYGFAIPFFIHSLDTLQGLFPSLPYIPMKDLRDFAPGLPTPWSGADSLFFLIHPVGIGFGYLIDVDTSFSLWFFYLLKKAVNIYGVAQGWRQPGQGWFGDASEQFPCTGFQGDGAWLALAVLTLWAGRGYFKPYLLRAVHGDPTGIEAKEPLSARIAVLGFLGGALALCCFVWIVGGSWWLPVAFIVIYILIMVALSRIRAETAVLCTELIWINPQSIISIFAGTSNMSHTDLAHMGMLSWFNTDYRAAPMPHELEGLVAQSRSKGNTRVLIPLLIGVSLFAMVAALLWDLQMYYVNGASTAATYAWVSYKGSEPWTNLQAWLHYPKPPDPAGMVGAAFGVFMMVVLTALRARFVGFPLVPAAYALNCSFANDFFWCDMFVAWLAKSLILRFGGMKLYRSALPFFLGLILGDFITGAAWSLIGAIFHLNLYRSFAV